MWASPSRPSPSRRARRFVIRIDGVEIERATKKACRIEHNGVGSVSFAINRWDEQATEAVLRRGSFIECVWSQIDPEPNLRGHAGGGRLYLISSKEEGGGETGTGGRGTLGYLDRARMDAEQYEGARQECFPREGHRGYGKTRWARAPRATLSGA